MQLRIIRDQPVSLRFSGYDAVARRYKVRLQQVVVGPDSRLVDAASSCRTSRGKIGDRIVTSAIGLMGIDRSHGYYRRIGSGSGDAAVTLEPVLRESKIARSGDYDYSSGYSASSCATEWIGLPGLGRCGTEAQVHHFYVLKCAVLNTPVDAGNDVTRLPESAPVENSHIDETGARCNPVSSACRSGRGRGYVSSVTVAVFITTDQRPHAGQQRAGKRADDS